MSMRRGSVLYGYTLERRIDSGGFSEIWAARDAEGRSAALKLLRPPVSALAQARLVREIDAHARVEHPNVCRMLDVLPEQAGLAFELLTGPSLARSTSEHVLDVEVALTVACDVLGALDAVHAAGIVHR